jgi:nitroreductase
MPANMGAYGALDLGGFVASFLLAAQAEGVATLAQAALAQHCGAIREMFDIPKDRVFVCGVSFGRADMSHPANSFRASRASLEEIFRFA